jgi:hypothetical protein
MSTDKKDYLRDKKLLEIIKFYINLKKLENKNNKSIR